MEVCEIVITGASHSSIYYVNHREVHTIATSGQSSIDCCCTKLIECVPSNPKQFLYHVSNGKLCIILNTYMAATFVSCIATSQVYRQSWLAFSRGASRRLFVLEILPDDFYLDKAWQILTCAWFTETNKFFRGRRVEYLARERLEVESAFSWLSTLGGAFSALGDSFDHCVGFYMRLANWMN